MHTGMATCFQPESPTKMSQTNRATAPPGASVVMAKLWPMSLPVQFVATVAAISLAAFAAFWRMPPTSRGVLWAEDGGIFLQDALARKGILDVFSPYEGYLHLLPRLAAKSVVRFFPPDNYAVALNFLSCVVVGVVAYLVFHCSKSVTSNMYARLGWASITILVAPAPWETLGNFANIHSYLLWLTPWLLLKPAQSKLEGVLLFFTATLLSMTEIVAVLFAPLIAVRFKDRRLWPARIGLLLGLVAQFVTTMLHPRSPSSPYPLDLGSAFMGWFLNSSSALVYGSSGQISANIRNYGFWPALVAVLPFAAALAYILVKGDRRKRLLAAVLLLGSTGVWGATMVLNFQEYFDYASFDEEQWKSFFLSRYSTVPSMFLLALIPLAALCDTSKRRTISVAIFSAFVVLQCIYFFPASSPRNNGPDWSEGVSTARADCSQNPGTPFQPVGISPAGWRGGVVNVPCSLLLPAP